MTGERPQVRTWIKCGDHLKLDGYPISIRRIDQQGNWRYPRFRIDIEGLASELRMTLELAKDCGEEHANEIDELPIPSPAPPPAAEPEPEPIDLPPIPFHDLPDMESK